MKLWHPMAVLTALGGFACSNNQPAQDPSSAQAVTPVTTTTTESSTTSSQSQGSLGSRVNDNNAQQTLPDTSGMSPATTRQPSRGTGASSATAPSTSLAPETAYSSSTAPTGSSTNDGKSATSDKSSTPPAPDNTRVNARDRKGAALTPMDQGGSEGDRTTTQKIRQAVVKDGSLSFTAKNVKIITQNGKVTLRGPVKSADERASIEAAAKRIAGDAQVDNQLEITK